MLKQEQAVLASLQDRYEQNFTAIAAMQKMLQTAQAELEEQGRALEAAELLPWRRCADSSKYTSIYTRVS